jgi:hypothetical protein
MSALATAHTSSTLRSRIVRHMVATLEQVSAIDEPFSHCYWEGVFPEDVYEQLLDNLPDPAVHYPCSLKRHKNEMGKSTRDWFELNDTFYARLPDDLREFWTGVQQALCDDALRRKLFEILQRDLAYRFGFSDPSQAREIPARAEPRLCRDLDTYEIAPHPDGRQKIVTMQIYLPRDRSQIELGTALYRRRFPTLRGLTSWHGRFRKVKQFPFLPNSAYAFVVSNGLWKKSWHGREAIPAGSGVRNSLFNTFYVADA